MKQNILEFVDDFNKAIDRAVWLQFQCRKEGTKFVVYDGPEDNFAVSDLQTADDMEMVAHSYSIVDSYKDLSYEKLESLSKDSDPLPHWEELLGRFSVMEGELLRFILQYQIPVEKIIRHELANRGFDQNNMWVGFDTAKEIWQVEA